MSARVPRSAARGEAVSWWSYLRHARARDWGNFSFRRHRQFDVYLVTMHQGGTHWLKYLLTLMIAREHGLPPPASISENIVIGGPRETPRYATTPRIGHSHTIPSPLIRLTLAIPALGLPDYVVLVRDIRDILLAHYVKWRERYDCSFSEFLRGDVTHQRFEKDLWWDLRFLNTWGAAISAHPGRFHVVHYEQLQRDPTQELTRLIAFMHLPLADPTAAIAYAVANASKQAMADKDVHPYGMPVVRDETRDWDSWYGAADRAWFAATCRRHLRHDFGYGYADWR